MIASYLHVSQARVMDLVCFLFLGHGIPGNSASLTLITGLPFRLDSKIPRNYFCVT